MKIEIREALEVDLPDITEIFNWHAENGIATFSDSVSLENRSNWFSQFKSSQSCKLFVAVQNSAVVGYACNMLYRGGGVFKDTTETSIYVRDEYSGRGIGKSLYSALFQHLTNIKVHRVVVGIALPNDGSIALHKKFGFEEIGTFDEYAYYKGQYRSSLWMQKKFFAS